MNLHDRSTDANGKLTAEQITALRVVFVNGVNVDERQLLPACIQWNETEYLNALATLCDMALASLSEMAPAKSSALAEEYTRGRADGWEAGQRAVAEKCLAIVRERASDGIAYTGAERAGMDMAAFHLEKFIATLPHNGNVGQSGGKR